MGNEKFKIKKLIFIPLILAACLFTGLGVSSLVKPTAQAAVLEYYGEDIPTRGKLGTSVSLPKSVTVDYKGASKTATDGVIVSPSDKITAVTSSLKLAEEGKYTIKYYFAEGNVKHTVKHEIEVYSDYYSVTANGTTVKLSDAENSTKTGKNGVIIDLKQGDTFTYNEPLDLTKVGENGLAEVIEIDGILGYTDENKKTDNNPLGYVSNVEAVWVRLTDCYNPTLYAELRIGKSPDYSGSMFTGVRTSYQPCTGLGDYYHHSCTEVKIDGRTYWLWPDDRGYMSSLGQYNTPMKTGFIWRYDYDQKRFYIAHDDTEDRLVTDLDEPIIFTDGNFFPDWTTGEVYVSMYGDNYLNGTSGRVELYSIGGKDLYSSIQAEYDDAVAPAITINAKKTEIKGAVGDTIVIPEATATDVNLVGDVEVAVYRGYGTDFCSNVSVTNGKFVLAESGTYTVLYTATDKAGNVGRATLTVNAEKYEGGRAIALTPIKPDSLIAGVSTTLGFSYDSLNQSDVTVKIRVESENQSAEFDKETEFTPLYSGNYKITYVYGDDFYSYEKSFNYDCKVDASVVSFDTNVVLPKTFIKGFYYSIDGVKAYNYVKGYPSAAPMTAYAVFDGGSKQKIDDINKVEITGSKTVKFVFEAESATYETETVSITDVSGTLSSEIKGASLFTGNFSSNLTGDKLTLASKTKSGNNSFKFINAVSARNFTFGYKIPDGSDNFASLKLTLTDYANPLITLTIEVFNNEDGAYMSVNGETAKLVDGLSFAGENNNITYNYAAKKVALGKGYSLVDVDFTSGKCYLTVETLGMTGETAVTVNKINNQTISRSIEKDKFGPQIYFVDNQGEYAKGEIVKIRAAEFSDVITGVDASSISFSILANDGGPVKDAKGNAITEFDYTKDYEILLDRITDFFAVYTAKDFAGNQTSSNYMISCVDTTAPTITLTNMNEGGVIRVKAGHEINLCFNVTDDISSPSKITTYIHLYCDDMYGYVPNFTDMNEKNRPSDGKFDVKFVIDIRGNYTAQIHCYDEKNNHSVTRVKIIVE